MNETVAQLKEYMKKFQQYQTIESLLSWDPVSYTHLDVYKRQIIDLALNFSSGPFQNQFLRAVQSMLLNQKSAYYKVAKNAADFVSHDTLCHFGINVGYNGCTKGADLILSLIHI